MKQKFLKPLDIVTKWCYNILTTQQNVAKNEISEVIKIHYLKKIRQERHLTQQQIADIIGISRQYVGLLEIGVRGKKLPVPTAKKIAAALNIDWREIYKDEEEGDT